MGGGLPYIYIYTQGLLRPHEKGNQSLVPNLSGNQSLVPKIFGSRGWLGTRSFLEALHTKEKTCFRCKIVFNTQKPAWFSAICGRLVHVRDTDHNKKQRKHVLPPRKPCSSLCVVHIWGVTPHVVCTKRVPTTIPACLGMPLAFSPQRLCWDFEWGLLGLKLSLHVYTARQTCRIHPSWNNTVMAFSINPQCFTKAAGSHSFLQHHVLTC